MEPAEKSSVMKKVMQMTNQMKVIEAAIIKNRNDIKINHDEIRMKDLTRQREEILR